MGYRDTGLALHLRVDSLDRELAQTRARANTAERARAEVEEQLARLRDGLLRRRRWGWVASVVACVLWLPTPLFFVSGYSLARLFRAPTLRVFFHR